ncbi:MAG: RluA family pseudouridine synthase [Christensenellales bacterium]|jgi:23S rRNA pseudouridine1911/1915/1917 synthase
MARRIEFCAPRAERLDVLVAESADMTRSRAASLIRQGRVAAGGAVAGKAGYMVKAGESIAVDIPEPMPARAKPEDIDIEVLYQDEELAVVYKPSGMVAHPAAGNPGGTLVNALLAKLDRLSGIGGEMRPGLVHRLDRDTSGLLLIAKTDRAHAHLSAQIAARTVERGYWAIVEGAMREDAGFVDAPIGRHPHHRKKMAVVPGGRAARTNWRVQEPLRGATLLECALVTGRTHQIRVHMASIGRPVLGDETYGAKKPMFAVAGGQLLHAYKVGFSHPASGEILRFTAPPEPRFLSWYHKLGGTSDEIFT